MDLWDPLFCSFLISNNSMKIQPSAEHIVFDSGKLLLYGFFPKCYNSIFRIKN
jgi:hypothetical protein